MDVSNHMSTGVDKPDLMSKTLRRKQVFEDLSRGESEENDSPVDRNDDSIIISDDEITAPEEVAYLSARKMHSIGDDSDSETEIGGKQRLLDSPQMAPSLLSLSEVDLTMETPLPNLAHYHASLQATSNERGKPTHADTCEVVDLTTPSPASSPAARPWP